MNYPATIGNSDIIPYAIYQLGGIGTFIDVEEIFNLCYRLSPERFGWRKYPYPNYKILSKALRDFEGKYPQHLLKTSDGLGRQLSAEGLDWLKKQLPILEKALKVPGINPPVRRPVQRMLNDLANSAITREFIEGGKPEIRKHEVADLLLCSPDSPVSVFKERMETYRAAAKDGGRLELLAFLDYLRQKHSELF